MADHLRKQIRAAAATALTGLSTTGNSVFTNREQDLQAANLPALRISTGDEESQMLSMGVGRLRQRTLVLVVEACVKANTAYDDTVDQICKEVEVALDASNTLGGLCKWIEPRSFQFESDGEGDKVVAVGKMTFDVVYVTAQSAPDVAH